MYVVKRPFKSYGKHYTYGDIVREPSDIKLFKSRLAEGKLIEVNENNYDNIATYFKAKFNVELPPLNQEAEEANQDDSEDATAEVEGTTDAEEVTTKASVVVKAN